MATPELKQFGELEAEDFDRHPVWVGCHTADYGKPWYEDTDEETFRPHTGKLPADPSGGMFLVRTAIELRDGSRYPGFVTPAAAGWDKRPGGGPMLKHDHILGTQQPQIFVGDRAFGFWGGMAGIPGRTQQELYAALGKAPDAVFPLRFTAETGLAMGIAEGEVDGFYRGDRNGIHVGFVGASSELGDNSAGPTWFQMGGRGGRGYPRPEKNFEYLRIGYSGTCFRCGIFDRQVAPFRFKKSASPSPSGFTQLGWVHDAFFAPPAIVDGILKAGITGVSLGPAVYHRTGAERTDLAQLIIPTVIACAEASRLSTVTCRPENEETVAIRAMIAKQKPLPVPMSSDSSPEKRSVSEECPQLRTSKTWVCRARANDNMANKTAAKIGSTMRSGNLFDFPTSTFPRRLRIV